MRETIKKQFYVQWKDWIWFFGLVLGGYVIGMILHYVLTVTDSTATSYFPLGTIMGMAMAGVYLFVMVLVQIRIYFNLEVSMGCTRAGFLVSFYLVNAAGTLLGAGFLTVLEAAENALDGLLYPGLEREVDLLPYLLKWGVPAAVAVPMLAGFMGALLIRYGRKAFWVLWGLWMFGALVLPRILEAASEAPETLYGRVGGWIAREFGAVSTNVWIAAGAVGSLLCLAGSWMLIRKQQVVS